MKPGKLPPEHLDKLVLSRLGPSRPEVLLGAAFGEDSAVLDLGDSLLVASTDPLTGATSDAGWLAIHVACNDVAAHGAEPVGILLTVLLAPGSSEEDLEAIMDGVLRAASGLNVEVLGGHTEITPGLEQTIISTTALGKAARGRDLITSGSLRPGDSLFLTKGAGLEGTAIFAGDIPERLEGLEAGLLERARAFMEEISVVPEAMAASECGATAMHDVTEGGVLGAVYEMVTASGVGAEIWAERIPIRPETKAICRVLSVDPLRLIGSGSLLIGTPDPEELSACLEDLGVEFGVIGHITEERGVFMARPGKREAVEPPSSDELWRILGER